MQSLRGLIDRMSPAQYAAFQPLLRQAQYMADFLARRGFARLQVSPDARWAPLIKMAWREARLPMSELGGLTLRKILNRLGKRLHVARSAKFSRAQSLNPRPDDFDWMIGARHTYRDAYFAEIKLIANRGLVKRELQDFAGKQSQHPHQPANTTLPPDVDATIRCFAAWAARRYGQNEDDMMSRGYLVWRTESAQGRPLERRALWTRAAGRVAREMADEARTSYFEASYEANSAEDAEVEIVDSPECRTANGAPLTPPPKRAAAFSFDGLVRAIADRSIGTDAETWMRRQRVLYLYRRGVTQDQIAARINVNQSQVSRDLDAIIAIGREMLPTKKNPAREVWKHTATTNRRGGVERIFFAARKK